jgi:hypothetical protein
MFSPVWLSPIRCACLVSGVAMLAAVSASGQSATPLNQPVQITADESSSTSGQFTEDEVGNGAAALRTAAASLGSEGGGGAAAGQDYGSHHDMFSHLAFEASGGANGPSGNTSNYLTWGGNFTVGGGLHFSKRFALLAEYQFLDDKLPGDLIAETGADGGHAHIWSLTLDPVFDLLPNSTNSVYVTGGGGFYRKVTSFTDPQEAEYCDYYYCGVTTENVVVGHFSSNQGGYASRRRYVGRWEDEGVCGGALRGREHASGDFFAQRAGNDDGWFWHEGDPDLAGRSLVRKNYQDRTGFRALLQAWEPVLFASHL